MTPHLTVAPHWSPTEVVFISVQSVGAVMTLTGRSDTCFVYEHVVAALYSFSVVVICLACFWYEAVSFET